MKRQASINARLAVIEEYLKSFDGPLSGRIGEMLGNFSRQREEAQRELEQMTKGIEDSQKDLSLWYERRGRLETSDPLGLVIEVSALSDDVKEKNEIFKKSTMNYVGETEKLRYSPDDKNLAASVEAALATRKQHMADLIEALKTAVATGITDTEKHIAEFTARKDETESRLRDVEQDVETCRTMLSGGENARQEKKKALLKEQAQLHAESIEISRAADTSPPVMTEASAASLEQKPQAAVTQPVL